MKTATEIRAVTELSRKSMRKNVTKAIPEYLEVIMGAIETKALNGESYISFVVLPLHNESEAFMRELIWELRDKFLSAGYIASYSLNSLYISW